MIIYYIGKMNGSEWEIIPINEADYKNNLEESLRSALKNIQTEMEFSELCLKDMRIGTALLGTNEFHIKVLSKNGAGIFFVTDTEFSFENEEITAISNMLESLPVDLEKLNRKIDFFTRVTSLPANADKSAFLILAPLRKKLEEEINSEKKQAAEMMIDAMKEAILLRLENKIDSNGLKELFNAAISAAAPILEKQGYWVVNKILDYFKPNTLETRLSLFSHPNRFKSEILQIQAAVQANNFPS